MTKRNDFWFRGDKAVDVRVRARDQPQIGFGATGPLCEGEGTRVTTSVLQKQLLLLSFIIVPAPGLASTQAYDSLVQAHSFFVSQWGVAESGWAPIQRTLVEIRCSDFHFPKAT